MSDLLPLVWISVGFCLYYLVRGFIRGVRQAHAENVRRRIFNQMMDHHNLSTLHTRGPLVPPSDAPPTP